MPRDYFAPESNRPIRPGRNQRRLRLAIARSLPQSNQAMPVLKSIGHITDVSCRQEYGWLKSRETSNNATFPADGASTLFENLGSMLLSVRFEYPGGDDDRTKHFAPEGQRISSGNYGLCPTASSGPCGHSGRKVDRLDLKTPTA